RVLFRSTHAHTTPHTEPNKMRVPISPPIASGIGKNGSTAISVATIGAWNTMVRLNQVFWYSLGNNFFACSPIEYTNTPRNTNDHHCKTSDAVILSSINQSSCSSTPTLVPVTQAKSERRYPS